MSYDSEVLADSPIFYLKLDEASGTTCADSSGNGNTFTYQAGVVLAQPALLGDGGYSISGNGSVSPSIMTSVPAALTASTPFTLEAWVYLTTTLQDFNIVSIGSGYDGYSMDVNSGTGYATSGNRLGAAAAGRANIPSGADIGTGAHHVVATRNGGQGDFYIDGVSVYSYAAAWGTIYTPTTQCTVGGPIDKLQTSQRIDNVAVYATALSPTRVAAHFAAASGGGGGGASQRGPFREPAPLRRQAIIRAAHY